ncbi:hypothetical protein GOALK_053_00550 [Gordonia alkanivorans NBRC 16433]|uniref:Uncharacterized protein n=1 Tax=Gordonia alkanivorans NBRC 16433 TaxID=1027371 RepID=F9VV96_9ACTN|nr:hypothetical protein GOALK_053_00550 [Gordonia alkanivorans NBRC 16433]
MEKTLRPREKRTPSSSAVRMARLRGSACHGTPSAVRATATIGDTTEVDRPATCEQALTALLHAHEGTTVPIKFRNPGRIAL